MKSTFYLEAVSLYGKGPVKYLKKYKAINVKEERRGRDKGRQIKQFRRTISSVACFKLEGFNPAAINTPSRPYSIAQPQPM
jgi:hypothetical protein